MTVQELMDIEKKYKERHNSAHLKLNQASKTVPDNMDEDIRFLADGYITKHYNPSGKTTSVLNKQGLDDFEILLLKCFVGGVSHAFKWNSYEDRNSPIPEMCDGLDRVLDKTPIYDEGKALFRFCTIDDRVDFQEGEIYHAPHYITTTKNNWKRKTNVYIITPKKEGTNARSLYKLNNHGNENQVTFKRDTNFRITKIKGGKRIIIYMEEI